jgi:hypothetical protein
MELSRKYHGGFQTENKQGKFAKGGDETRTRNETLLIRAAGPLLQFNTKKKRLTIKDEVAYMGDDLPDIPLARRAGLAVCVADGAPDLAAMCHFPSRRLGGRVPRAK